MTRYDTGDVLLLEFPFTSEAGLKRRPAVVILDAGDADVVVARITTQPYATGFDVAITNWQGVAGAIGHPAAQAGDHRKSAGVTEAGAIAGTRPSGLRRGVSEGLLSG
jgi:hypothetical protein